MPRMSPLMGVAPSTAWGLFGALAIAMFGNLDPWRQLFTRDVDYGVRTRWIYQEKVRIEDWKIEHGVHPRDLSTLLASVASAPEAERKSVAAEKDATAVILAGQAELSGASSSATRFT